MAILLAGMASAVEAATATATWDKNPESDVTGYKLSYGTVSGTPTTTVDVGNVTTWVISTLTAGQRYYFVVQAYNLGGLLSAKSIEALFDVPATPSPAITTVSPASGAVATTVTITGANFGATRGTSSVTFNGTAATPATWGATSIAVPVPAGATTGNVVVTVGGLASNGAPFTVTVAPAITTLSPASGPVATAVTITGASFGATQGTSTVTFNGTAATPTTWGAASLVVQVPAGVTTGPVVVTVGGNISNGVVFTLNRPPTLSAIANQSSAENALVSLQLVGSDPEGAAIAYTATNLPGGLILASTTGAISGTLTYTSAGSYSVVVTASDGTLTASQTFTWTVTDVNRPPTLAAVADQTSTPNVNASLQLAGSDPDGTVVSYGAAGLPSGVTIDAATGLISGAAATGSNGLYPVTATVSDGTLTASRTFTWTVAAAVVPTSPVMDVAVWAEGATARTTIVSPGFSTTIGNELVLAFVATDYVAGANTTVTGVTGAGLTWALVGRTNAQAGTSEIWRAFAPAPLTGVTVTATLSQAVASLLTVMSFSNVDSSGTNGSGAIGATATASLASGAPTATLVTTRDNAWVMGVGNDFDRPIARTVGAGQTLVRQYLPPVGDTYWVQRLLAPTLLAGTSVTLNDTAPATDRFNLFVVEIRPPAASVTTTLTVSPIAPAAEAAAMDVMAATSTSDALRSTDYDGDGRSDLAVHNPVTGRWSILLSGTNYRDSMSIVPRISGYIPVPGDYDGDGKTDVAVYRPSTGIWYVLPSSTNYTGRLSRSLGEAGDVPVPGDYDGDGKTDFAVFRPTTHEWVVLLSSTGALTINSWGASGDVAVPGDYDGDHKTDIAAYTPSTGVWSILTSSTRFAASMTFVLGASTDIPVPADYDGDAATDVAVYRPSSGTWYILQSHTGHTEVVGLTLGGGVDVPVPGDYDGDGKADVAIYQTPTGVWQIIKSSDGSKMTGTWGTSADVPVPRRP